MHVPSLSLPSSAACPLGKIVFTNIPMLPFGESLPPTTEKPRLFLPRPFSKMTVLTLSARLRGRLSVAPPLKLLRPLPLRDLCHRCLLKSPLLGLVASLTVQCLLATLLLLWWLTPLLSLLFTQLFFSEKVS